ncbi:MAG: UDP-N-acetylmuramate--L-alanine ligase [Chloroflexi bacterium]|nr:UDP-N-acetylmuramate--L-alanine ligase [Chloroflexota bacterium]
MLASFNRIHFIGIGGAGLSAIARTLVEQGKQVSGSDQAASAQTTALAALGARISIGQRAENLADAELVVISSAVRENNPELAAARAAGLPVIKRDALLAEMMQAREAIAIAGTHGKTTTTAMTAFCLSELGLDPTFIVGGVMTNYGTNARFGRGPHFVIEADEYDHMFLGLKPRHGVVTNIEFDHPDCFADEAAMVRDFRQFVTLPSIAQAHGAVIVCGDSHNARALRAVAPDARSYGFADYNDYRIVDPQVHAGQGVEYVVSHDRRSIAVVRLGIPGRHNMLNACAVVALFDRLRLDMPAAVDALARFRGTQRRFEVRGEAGGITIVDDYAHHPTEIRATLSAARERYAGRRVWAVFQPHTYSRTRALLDEFAGAFAQADAVIITEIFPSREVDTLGVSGRDIVARMRHPAAQFAPTLAAAETALRAAWRPGDVLLLLGAGDINTLSGRLLNGLAGTAVSEPAPLAHGAQS